jgi:glucosamine--fructose-6-phosphate aminotransferase (isomerizing)
VLGVLLEGLARLEYRGYDSAGVALVGSAAPGGTWRARAADGTRSLDDLKKRAEGAPPGATAGIGHTRWATHGGPSEENAHPHADCSGRLALVHNGIIENHVELTDALAGSGHCFVSGTDTEVLAHLIESSLSADPGAGLVGAVREALGRVRGAFSVAVVHADHPDLVVAARRVSPLLMGVTESAAFLASDIPAILGLTREFFVLEDDQIAELRPGSVTVTALDGTEVQPVRLRVDWDLDAARKDGYDDFMSKEMHEQAKAVADTLLDRLLPDGTLVLDEVHLTPEEFSAIDKVFIVACGSSYHAGLMAKYAIEHWARLPVEIDIASEFRYRDPVLDTRTLVIGVSQSGETVDTFQAIREARRLGAKVLVISNVVDSSMARERRRPLHEGGTGDRRGRHQDPPGPDHRPGDPRPLPGAGAGDPGAGRRPRPAGGHGRPPRQGGPGPGAGRRRRRRGRQVPRLAVVHLPRAPGRLPGGPRGRPQVEGALLSAGRGVPRR